MFRRNLEEIRNSLALQWFGISLGLIHMVTIYFWRHLPDTLSRTQNALCWSWFPDCGQWRFSSPNLWFVVLGLYFACSILGIAGFVFKKLELGYFSLLSAFLIKQILHGMDYSLMGNYHYMHFLVELVFLFFPRKVILIPVLIGFFYLAAGSLKLNSEWLGGEALLRPAPFGGRLGTIAGCAFVVFLELFVVFGLFARNYILRFGSFLFFVLFHLISYYWVSYYYPAVMLGLLSIFPFLWLSSAPPKKWTAVGGSGLVLLGVLSSVQILSLLGPDSSLYTQHRFWALNMYDARSECMPVFLMKYKDHRSDYGDGNVQRGVRLHCDPLVFLQEARNLCRQQGHDSNFQELDLILLAKRRSDTDFQMILNKKNFCADKGNQI